MKTAKTKHSTLLRKETKHDSGKKYEYYLYVKESARVASFGLPLYSVSVSLTDEGGESTNFYASDIFSDGERALLFFERLIENLATPLNLPYIIEDELS